MKHNITATILLITIFILAQIVGLSFVSMSTQTTTVEGEIVVGFDSTSIGERPETQGFETLIILFLGITIGTLILLYIAKKNKINMWRAWFFIASLIAISISLGVILEGMILWTFTLIIVVLRFYRPNFFTTNIAEILMYSGLAVFLVPILDVSTMLVILILISLYDMYAVWKSKHMITMAKFTSDNNLFPGLSLKYDRNKKDKKTSSKIIKSGKTIGVIGGGDVVFPLLFAGTILVSLVSQGVSKNLAFAQSSIIIFMSAISLLTLFYFSKKEKFYPAMPFITIGCLIGYVIILLI